MRQILSLCLLFTTTGNIAGKEISVSPAIPLAGGKMTVIRVADAAPTELLIHFHGAPEIVTAALVDSDINVTLAVVNFNGLSSAYSQPFAENPALFEQILERTALTVDASSGPSTPWQRVYVSSFSAGYGAIREILKTPSCFDRIDLVVAADSIYAGLQPAEPQRQVDKRNMRDFLRFSLLAADAKKTFLISHSAQRTPYASTTETADYLLDSLQITRQPDDSIRVGTMQQLSRASRGKFLVLGFDGTSGKAHMQHLRNIDLLWRFLSSERRIENLDGRESRR